MALTQSEARLIADMILSLATAVASGILKDHVDPSAPRTNYARTPEALKDLNEGARLAAKVQIQTLLDGAVEDPKKGGITYDSQPGDILQEGLRLISGCYGPDAETAQPEQSEQS